MVRVRVRGDDEREETSDKGKTGWAVRVTAAHAMAEVETPGGGEG